MAEISGHEFPYDLYYHEEDSWARVEKDGKVTIGVTDLFQKEAGNIVYLELPSAEDGVEQSLAFGKIQSRKWIANLIAPVSGEVIETNEAIETDSTIVNSDPYGAGWILRIQPSQLDEELGNLAHGNTVEDYARRRLRAIEEEKAQSQEED